MSAAGNNPMPSHQELANFSNLKIGILALQGCVKPHRQHLEAAGVTVVEIKKSSDFINLDGVILPGGESTTLLKLIRLFDLKIDLDFAAQNIPLWGICAGSILMAKKVKHPTQESFAYMNFEIERNAYGRQLQSFETDIDGAQVAFIRAPLIQKVGPNTKTLAQNAGAPVWVEEGMHMVTAFHPELSIARPSKIHINFLEKCAAQKNKRHGISETTSQT